MAKFVSIESVSIVPVPGASVKINKEGNIIGYNLPGFISLCKSSFRRGFQKIFRKSHISDDDLSRFDSYLIKRILPEIKAYRKRYLEHDVPQMETDDEKKDWLTVIDDIIFSFRWCLEVDILFDPPKKIAFFKEYYGQYISFEDDKDKHMEQYDNSLSRAYKSFELFGKFFVRKSDVPDNGLINLDISIAKRILPKIRAYREMFLKKNKDLGIYNKLFEYSKEKIQDEIKEWLTVIDETIYAMRWCLEVDMINETPQKTAFFKEYYGQYISSEEDKDKHIEQYDDSLYRAKRGFMLFGYFLSDCRGNVKWFL